MCYHLFSLPIYGDAPPCMKLHMCPSVYKTSTEFLNHMQLTPHALHHIHTPFLTCGCAWFAYASTLVCFIQPLRTITACRNMLQCQVAKFLLCPCVQLAAREAAVDKIWDSVVVESANSLINFRLYSEENNGQAGVSAQWHAQGNNTQTHSDLVMLCAQLSACIVLQHVGLVYDKLCS